MLQEEFFALVKKYAPGADAAQLWNDVKSAYTNKDRYFHNLSHLDQMFAALQEVKTDVEDWDAVVAAIFYHDLVYDVVQYVTDNNNEDRSAEQARQILNGIGFPPAKIERCVQHILATKNHRQAHDPDTNFLTDADLSILGQPWEDYKVYMDNIRREYEVYPDSIYYAGRTNVLKNFLRRERLFKTEAFYQRYAAAAKENMEREMEIISFY